MKCPACGAALKKISRKCTECGALLKKNPDGTLEQVTAEEAVTAVSLNAAVAVDVPLTAAVASVSREPEVVKAAPSLIAFPGVNRNALPEWRKELSERVREKQERRSREAQLEVKGAATATVEADAPGHILELLPPAELEPVNPIVEAALKRLERAHLQSFAHAGGAAAAAQRAQPEPFYV
ncbi:MAG TPA: zinc ribbon domain-containing protein, partial [Pyrinomonadaceae bacterium]|nr:zinc ribbon domain-containing protein [Pyrinomonadaceae bacterium]